MGGRLGGEEGWVAKRNLEDEQTGVQYLIALGWSLAQFTPGASPIHPGTIGERILHASVLCVGFIVATCFIGGITSTLSAVWAMNRYNSTQTFLLKKFLNQNKISRGLGARVTRYVEHVVEIRHKHVHMSKVHYLSFLSGPLHIALQREVLQPRVASHPLFPLYEAANGVAMKDVCTSALTQTQYAKHDSVFSKRMLDLA